jgi:hypothetical protein
VQELHIEEISCATPCLSPSENYEHVAPSLLPSAAKDIVVKAISVGQESSAFIPMDDDHEVWNFGRLQLKASELCLLKNPRCDIALRKCFLQDRHHIGNFLFLQTANEDLQPLLTLQNSVFP